MRGRSANEVDELGRHWLGSRMRGTTYDKKSGSLRGETTYEWSGASTPPDGMESSSPLSIPRP